MDASDFNHLINTDHYAPADLEKVNDLCRNYPMFNLAHMLKVRIRESLAYDKEKELKIAAVYASDRRKLYQMVSEVTRPEPEEEPLTFEPEGIHFSSESHPEADVIIEQHAPYVGAEPAEDELLELDDEPEVTSTTLIESVGKDEVEMEEPLTEVKETPVMEKMDSVDDHDPGTDIKKEEPHGSRLILNFLKEDPGPIRADKSRASNKDVSLASIREHDGFITDTLAKIYVKQGLFAKAIYAYEKLSLKYPEKSAYFAAQIEKINNINHS